MKAKSAKLAVFLLCLLPALISAVSFTQQPVLTGSSANWTVTFAVNEYTDVEVAIVQLSDSTIVRHLAAGVLGANPPAPLTPNALSQTIPWNGKDDLGNVVKGSVAVRVRAGMTIKLDKFAGGNPYAFRGASSGYWSFQGLTVGLDGNLYVYGSNDPVQSVTLRQYDGSGTYIKTVYPWPANLSSAQVTGFGVNNWLNGKLSPKTTRLPGPDLSSTILSKQTSAIFPIAGMGEVSVADLAHFNIVKVNTDGSINSSGAQFPLITSPALPGNYNKGGPRFATLAANGKEVYLSGFYETGSTNGFDPVAPNTGFWKDGQIFKVNLATGVVTPFISLDSVPVLAAARSTNIGPVYAGSGANTCAAFHGTAIDDSGRIYAADRHHSRISIYDTLGALQGSIPLKYPEAIAYDKTTGAIFATNRIVNGYHSGYIRLYKFANRLATTPSCSVTIATTGLGEAPLDKTYLGQTRADNKSIVWVGYVATGVQAFRDDGTTFTKVKDFYAENADALVGFERLAVDKRNDNVLIQDSWFGIYKITDWAAPKIRPCTTSTGARLYGGDVSVSADHQLYVREGTGYNGGITRWDLSARHAPVPYANTGKNVLTPFIYSRMGVGYGEHGFAISPEPDKRFAVMYMWDWTKYGVMTLADSAQLVKGDTTGYVDTVVKPIEGGYVGCGGVRYDTKGNLYFGVSVKSPDHVVPAGFTADWGYQRGVGGIVRVPKGNRASVNVSTKAIPGSDYIYKQGFGPFSGTSGECQCRAPRFDIDLYNRLFIPNGITQKVTIVDNNDNVITQFGEYGNTDSKGAGSLVPTTDIPFAWPIAAVSSDNYVYVSDIINTRVARILMEYSLDNMGGKKLVTADYTYASGGTASECGHIVRKGGAFAMSAEPNPFNPVTTISVTLPDAGAVNLMIYDAAGRMVEKVASGNFRAGTHNFVWNASNRPVGVYALKLTAGSKRLVKLAVLSK
ncbi:MAG: T9SS type A sorting domain-containing protein [Fibrobacteres bacterium]|nr:T9SS type A sorting domain-containing protein [Fibrobacterota bacterium]